MSDTNEILGWKNKWECAVEMAARAEVERDEAREDRDTIQTELEMWRDGNILHEIHRNELEKVERERDDAREKYATEATVHMLAVNKLANERDEALSQIVQAECRAERFCQERDELIEENKKLNKEVDDLIRQRPLLIEDFKRERNEARDALMKIEDLFIDGTDIYADREKMGMIARNELEETK